MTDESSDYELPIDEFTVPELRIGIALQRKEIDRLKARVGELELQLSALGMHADELAAALKEAQADATDSAGVWVPVTEMQDDQVLLCYRPRADMKVYMQYRLNGQWLEEDGSPTIPATHWLDVRLPTGEQR